MKKISKLRGMQDIEPFQAKKYDFIEMEFNSISKSYGYDEIRIPILENTELFKRSVGDESDIVNKEMLIILYVEIIMLMLLLLIMIMW